MRKVILFYRQGSNVPFWKTRTVDVSKERIDTEPLPGAALPRCEPGMLVVVDGELGGVVDSVARLGTSSRFRIVLRRQIDPDEKDLIAALEKLARLLGVFDEGDVDGEPSADEGTPKALADFDKLWEDGALTDEVVQDDDAGAQARNGAEVALPDEDKPPAKRKRKRKPKAGEGEK